MRTDKRTNIAILGATSHIAKGLIFNFIKNDKFRLHLHSRSAERLNDFLRSIGKSPDENCIVVEGYDSFSKEDYDVLINCVGVGTKKTLGGNYHRWFTVTEEFDNLCINYLREKNQKSLYISLSSGAIYGRGLNAPAVEDSLNCLPVNHIKSEDYYAIARLNAEAKHRSFKDFNIVDLRLFSYFSRFANLSEGYFITDVLESILNNRELLTNASNIIRDYVHPEDLFLIVLKCIEVNKINSAFDVTSKKLVEKNELLDFFSRKYALKYKVENSLNISSGTGAKNIYCSKWNSALEIGYRPKYSSMDAIKLESEFILNKKGERK
jgi:nucleoside-diphosphate-sugar epimerase